MIKFKKQFYAMMNYIQCEKTQLAIFKEVLIYDSSTEKTNLNLPELTRLTWYQPTTGKLSGFVSYVKNDCSVNRVKKHRTNKSVKINTCSAPVDNKNLNLLEEKEFCSLEAFFNHHSKQYLEKNESVKKNSELLTDRARKTVVREEDVSKVVDAHEFLQKEYSLEEIKKADNVSRIVAVNKYFKELFMSVEKKEEKEAKKLAIRLFKQFIDYSLSENKINEYRKSLGGDFKANLSWVLNKAFNPVHMSVFLNSLKAEGKNN